MHNYELDMSVKRCSCFHAARLLLYADMFIAHLIKHSLWSMIQKTVFDQGGLGITCSLKTSGKLRMTFVLWHELREISQVGKQCIMNKSFTSHCLKIILDPTVALDMLTELLYYNLIPTSYEQSSLRNLLKQIEDQSKKSKVITISLKT